jgi:hypothetical protein
MIRHVLALTAVGLALVAAPAFASETINVPFTMPDGGVSTGLYDGTVEITVSGVGQSEGSLYNDAFYIYDNGPPYHDASYYQLTFGTSTLVGFDPSQDISNYLVGGIPAYDPSHTYTFEIMTGASVPTALHFGVSDGNFADTSGAYTVTITQVPELSTWAMMLAGFVGLGVAAATGRKSARSVA